MEKKAYRSEHLADWWTRSAATNINERRTDKVKAEGSRLSIHSPDDVCRRRDVKYIAHRWLENTSSGVATGGPLFDGIRSQIHGNRMLCHVVFFFFFSNYIYTREAEISFAQQYTNNI